MRGWKKDKTTKPETSIKTDEREPDRDAVRRLAAKRARQDAGRRAKRLVTAWAKATEGWKPRDALGELESRVARAIRASADRGK